MMRWKETKTCGKVELVSSRGLCVFQHFENVLAGGLLFSAVLFSLLSLLCLSLCCLWDVSVVAGVLVGCFCVAGVLVDWDLSSSSDTRTSEQPPHKSLRSLMRRHNCTLLYYLHNGGACFVRRQASQSLISLSASRIG